MLLRSYAALVFAGQRPDGVGEMGLTRRAAATGGGQQGAEWSWLFVTCAPQASPTPDSGAQRMAFGGMSR
jgi:hypothetical protein